MAEISVKKSSDGTVKSVFKNSDMYYDGWFRMPLPAPPLVPLDPPEPITEIHISWGGQGGAQDVPVDEVEYKVRRGTRRKVTSLELRHRV